MVARSAGSAYTCSAKNVAEEAIDPTETSPPSRCGVLWVGRAPLLLHDAQDPGTPRRRPAPPAGEPLGSKRRYGLLSAGPIPRLTALIENNEGHPEHMLLCPPHPRTNGSLKLCLRRPKRSVRKLQRTPPKFPSRRQGEGHQPVRGQHVNSTEYTVAHCADAKLLCEATPQRFALHPSLLVLETKERTRQHI
ncbi:hypothetical protein DPEC_G00052270 [Dallia pectoralis]|uniref:Uncharacterized protein n=1 Tax=Dallia pectoralis TaxID=75939 RepID=A0ACC2HBV8_DALPE|nr:hypothetical protein DPEC_G00052270 [Dallia pectoralis]